MPRRTHRWSIAALSIALAGAALSGGCALIYPYDDYTGAGGSSSAASSGQTASASAQTASSSSSSSSSSGVPNLHTATWAQAFGGAGYDVAGRSALDVAPSGDVFIAGTFEAKIDFGSTGTLTAAQFGLYLAKLDAKGLPLWSTAFAETKTEFASLAATPDGGVVVTGSFDISAKPDDVNIVMAANGSHDIVVTWYNNDGSVRWGHVASALEEQYAKAVAVDSNGMVYLTGKFQGTLTLPGCSKTAQSVDGDGFIAQLDINGQCKWMKTFTSTAMPTTAVWGQSLAAVDDGVLLGGEFTGMMSFDGAPYAGAPIEEGFVAKVKTDGTVAFLTPIAGVQDIYVARGPGGEPYYGATMPNPMPMPDLLTVGVLTSTGGLKWQTSYSGPDSAHLSSITIAPSGDVYITGSTQGPMMFGQQTTQYGGTKDMLLARLTAAGVPQDGVAFGDAQIQFGRGVRADTMGNLYLFGEFQGNIDFGMAQIMAQGGYDIAIAQFKLQ